MLHRINEKPCLGNSLLAVGVVLGGTSLYLLLAGVGYLVSLFLNRVGPRPFSCPTELPLWWCPVLGFGFIGALLTTGALLGLIAYGIYRCKVEITELTEESRLLLPTDKVPLVTNSTA